jgi:hypothetical protein
MPRTSGSYFYVYTMAYATVAAKERIERTPDAIANPGEIVAQAKMADSEYKAGMAFFRACRAARRNPLAFQVLVERGQEVIIDVRMP